MTVRAHWLRGHAAVWGAGAGAGSGAVCLTADGRVLVGMQLLVQVLVWGAGAGAV